MNLKNLDKAVGKAFTIVNEKIDKLTKKSEDMKAERKKEKEKEVKKILDSIEKIPTEKAVVIDYMEKLEDIKSKIGNEDVVKALSELKEEFSKKEFEVEIEKADNEKIEKLLEEIRDKTIDYNMSFPETQQVELTKKQLKYLTPFAYSSVDCKVMNDQDGRINPSTEDKQDDIITAVQAIDSSDDPLAKYKFADLDDDASPNYYGAVDLNGAWYILKEDTTAKTLRYATGADDYTTNWTNRVSLSYDYFYNVTLY